MKPTTDREWFERRVLLEEDLDVTAGRPSPEALPNPADELESDRVQNAEPAPQPAYRDRKRPPANARP